MPLRLYLVDRVTEKCTGKKRDYASEELFIKYAKETYERYNREFNYRDQPTGLKAKLCFLNEENKWQNVSDEKLEFLISKFK